jgi:dihydrofolate reductase
MRRIVAFNNVSADGYFAAPDGKLDWVVPDPEMDKFAAGAIARGGTDTILFGRKTYQMFASFWPHVLDDPETAPDPHTAGRTSAEMRAMAVMLNETPKVVFSKTLKEATWAQSRIVRDLDPDAIAAMKQERGKDMMIFGSGAIVSLLTRHGLIDEFLFAVSPILLGGGRTLLNGVSASTRLDLKEERRFPSGKVMLSYARSVPRIVPAEPSVAGLASAAAAVNTRVARGKTTSRTSAPKPVAATLQPDNALSKVVGSGPMTGKEVTKKLWAYIKRKGLQDKQNKRMINADDALRPVFGGKAQVNMAELPRLVEKHLKSRR